MLAISRLSQLPLFLIWIYLVANFTAAIVAAFVFNLINPPAQVTPIPTDEPAYETAQ